MINFKVKTKGMHCPSCEILVKDSLEEFEGVIKVDASHKSGIIIVKFDEKKINESKIKNVIKEEGYRIK